MAGAGRDGGRRGLREQRGRSPAGRTAPDTPNVPTPGAYTDQANGLSLRHPPSWQLTESPPNLVGLRGPGERECRLAILSDAPNLDTAPARRAHLRAQGENAAAGGGRLLSAREERGEGVVGVGFVVERSRNTVHSALFTRAGRGVSVFCVAPRADFAAAEREAFGPILASIALRPRRAG